ncbi:alkaline phosphatase family protein [Elusimicrobiota bacterium]
MIQSKKYTNKKIVIIGLDALTPEILERYKDELPNINKLIHSGYYSKLKIPNPAQSPVVWRSFVTGKNPGNHGLFDFIYRKPDDYLPRLSFTKVFNKSESINLSQFILRYGASLRNDLWENPFWHYTYTRGINSTILWAPTSFPPGKIKGKLICGMGTPDINGTLGSYTLITTDKSATENDNILTVNKNDNKLAFYLQGPRIQKKANTYNTNIAITVFVEGNKSVKISTPHNNFNLKENEWSPWIRLCFKSGSHNKYFGICRFFLIDIEPELKLYISPINIDPLSPVYPISTPKSFAKNLVKKYGYFSTLGMPYDTKAVNDNVLPEKEFLKLAEETFNFRKNIFLSELTDLKSGVIFSYFEVLDIIQHMFWKYIDGTHPSRTLDYNSEFEQIIKHYYKKIDILLNEVMAAIDDDTFLIILSDHGFNSFKRAVHINSWLESEGYLSLTDNAKKCDGLFENVNWEKTKAYSLGFGSIYLNLSGRERYGIVPGDKAFELKQEIKKKLETWIDKNTGDNVISQLYFSEHIFKGKYLDSAPDMYCGFNFGYRASWQTAIGGMGDTLIEDNLKIWSGDHIIDAALIPGVIICNKKIISTDPCITDIAPTILKHFNLPYEDITDGIPLEEE